MPPHSVEHLRHNHDFATIHDQGERRTWQVLALTAVTMALEIVAGTLYGSMALLADGWHMATHVAAFAIAIFAYRYARRHSDSAAFTFGVGKVSLLGGFTSAIVLAIVALIMLGESVQRVWHPELIHFDEAIVIAAVGLLVNLICALLLQARHDHNAAPAHAHDHNLKAAYVHVLADALTSVLAIIALVCGKYLGWNWLDPVMGLVGALVILRWSIGLVIESAPVLLDAGIEETRERAVRARLEADTDTHITDLHIWRVSSHHYVAVISLLSHSSRTSGYYKDQLRDFPELAHVTIEIGECPENNAKDLV